MKEGTKRVEEEEGRSMWRGSGEGEKNREECRSLCVTRSILISCFDFHKMGITLNHPGPPLLASYA